jgi:hypothetical protein
MTRLRQLETGGRLAVSLFCLTVLFALTASILLVMYSTASSGLVDPAAVKRKYAQNMMTGAMWGSMYEYVTEDESIHITQRWIDAGFPRDLYESEVKLIMAEDCTNCHSASSTMTKAIPSIPLTSYEDVVSFSTQGLPDGKLLKGLHVHLFGIGSALVILGVLLAFTGLAPLWKALIPLVGFAGLWLDTAGWIAGRVTESAAWMIIGGGALMNGALGAMAVLVLLDCWVRVPLLSEAPRAARRA